MPNYQFDIGYEPKSKVGSLLNQSIQMTTLDSDAALNRADQIMHSLAQLLALTAMQWLPTQPDDSQANLLWNSVQDRLESRAFTVGDHTIRLVIAIDSFTLYFVDEQEQVHAAFSVENRTPADALNWWTSQMQAWGLTDLNPLSYVLGTEPVQTTYERPDVLPTWSHWRTVANRVLTTLTHETCQKSEVRVWPHHFDTGVYYAVTDAAGVEISAIWAGYSIADALSNEPYFYLSGYVQGRSIDFSTALPLPIGAWRITENWQGALLPISAIGQTSNVDKFLQAAYDWLNKTER